MMKKISPEVMKMAFKNIKKGFNRKKDVSEDMMRTDLKRCFGLVDLTFLAISGMVGSGLYVLAGTVAHSMSGPSIVISYILAAIASALSATCYAEFASRVPVAGSAYQFTYLSVGELWAFIIGWNVAIEHAIYLAATAKSCAGYINQLADGAIGTYLDKYMHLGSNFFAPYPDFMAAILILIFAVTLLLGVKISSKINIGITIINLLVLIFIMATGFSMAKIENWTSGKGFFAFGWSGTLKGASTLVFSYVGYEMIASATEEAVNAARDIPISLGIAVFVVMFAYVGGSAALTLMVPYTTISVTAPFPTAYADCGLNWAKYIVTIGALAAMLACLLAILFVVPRYLLAMSRDGLLWKFLGKVHPSTQVPHVATITVAIVSMIMATLISLETLVEFIAIGQLLACTFVALCVVKLRYLPNDLSSYSRSDLIEPGEISMSALAMRQIGHSISFKSDQSLTKIDSNTDEIVNEQSLINSEVENREEKEEKNFSLNKENPESMLLFGQCSCGTLKKNVLNSSFGFAFAWATSFAPGVVVFRSLLLSVFCGGITCGMFLFIPTSSLKQPYAVLPLIILITTAVCSLALIAAFNPDRNITTFKVPLVPLIPYLSILINITLILKLQPATWLRLAVWIIIGLVIYGTYGFKNSKLASKVDSEND